MVTFMKCLISCMIARQGFDLMWSGLSYTIEQVAGKMTKMHKYTKKKDKGRKCIISDSGGRHYAS